MPGPGGGVPSLGCVPGVCVCVCLVGGRVVPGLQAFR